MYIPQADLGGDMSVLLKTVVRCSGFLLLLTLIACGGGGSKPAAEGDFTLTSTPAAITLVPGGTGQEISVTAIPANGFMGTVTVTITGLPAGVSAQPATLTLTPGTAQNVTVTASASATAGGATVTLTGTSGALSHSAAVTATISAPVPPPDFTLSVSPTTLTLTPGAVGSQLSITAAALNSFAGTVAVAITGLPAGVTANPATMTLTPGAAQSVTLTASTSAVAGTFTVTFTGTSGTLSHSTMVAVAVGSLPDFTLTTSPASLTAMAGAAGSLVSITAVALNSFTGSVAVAIGGLPAGVTANPATLNLTLGAAQSTTLTAALTAPAATSTVTFTGHLGQPLPYRDACSDGASRADD